MDFPILLKNLFSFKESPVRSSLTPHYFSYTITKGEGGKYPKQVLFGEIPIEVWISLL